MTGRGPRPLTGLKEIDLQSIISGMVIRKRSEVGPKRLIETRNLIRNPGMGYEESGRGRVFRVEG